MQDFGLMRILPRVHQAKLIANRLLYRSHDTAPEPPQLDDSSSSAFKDDADECYVIVNPVAGEQDNDDEGNDDFTR